MPHPAQDLLHAFRVSLDAPDPIAAIAGGVIGKNSVVDGAHGPRKLVYADYVASGRALRQVEAFMLDEVLPYYANSHSEASCCGAFITGLRRHWKKLRRAGT